jgi:hypothetical protein
MNTSEPSNESAPAELAPGIPLIESPFFDEAFPESSTDPETLRIARDLRDHGFAVLDFPDPAISEMADRIIHDLDGDYDWQAWRNNPTGSLRIQDAWMVHKDVAKIASNPALISLLSRLYGRQAFPFQTLNFAVGTQQHYHSDSVHFSCVPERFMCGVWVALEDIDMRNGPLVYYPGSHRWPIYTFEHLGINPDDQQSNMDNYGRFLAFWRKLVEASHSKSQNFLARKGQALIWAANLLHGGDSQTDLSRTRHSQVTHYYFENCSYYTPLDSYPTYGRIFFREPFNILTRQRMKNYAAGKPVPEEFISVTRPPAPPAPATLPTGFSPDRYLKLNPDVAAAGADPSQHYLEHGFSEGRRY